MIYSLVADTELFAALPLLVLLVVSLTMLGLDLLGLRRGRLVWTLSACVMAWLFALAQIFVAEHSVKGQVFVDLSAFVFTTIILAGTALTFLLGTRLQDEQRMIGGVDIDILLMLSAGGALVLSSSAHFILMFLGFELLSLPLYVLAGSARNERASAEAALKYFIFGAFSSAFLLYGMALVYGATGSMNMLEIAAASSANNGLLLLGIGLMVFGFGFKVSLAPFHVWTPDVYQGSPVSVVSFMAVVVKAAAFAAFLRLMGVAFGAYSEAWTGLIWVLSVLTMSVGNLAALRQQSIKRLLAYSSIAHAGYVLMGFLAFGKAGGGEAVVFYLISYGLMTIASFGVVLLASAGTSRQYGDDSVESLAGIGWSSPFLGLAMTVSLLSLAGFPPLAGFVAKFFLFKAVITQGFVGLAVIAAINSVVSLFYYLRLLVVMYFDGARDQRQEGSAVSRTSGVLRLEPGLGVWFSPRLAILLVSLATIGFGLFGDSLLWAVEVALRDLPWS